MKQSIQILAILGMVILSFVSCSKEKDIEISNENFYTVQICMTGEINVEYEPMTKSSPEDKLYAIQVYSTPNIALEEGEQPVWTPYAHYFNIGSAPTTIKLTDGYKYRFSAEMLVDEEKQLSLRLQSNHIVGCRPWMLMDGSPTHQMSPNSSIIYCTEGQISVGGNSGVQLGSNKVLYYRPNIDRYRGWLDDFVPSAGNLNASIEMKRVSFGAKFVFTGSLATSGTIGIEIEGAPKQTLSLSATAADNVHYDIYAFKEPTMADGYTETIPVKLDWTRTDGTIYNIGQFDIVYQRNTTTVVTIQLNNDAIESGLGIVIPDTESGTMTEPGTNDLTIIDGEIQ